MTSADDILKLLNDAYPDVMFELNGDGCHFQITAIGEIFADLKKIQRQQMLNQVLSDKIADGTVHAVNYKIYSPAEVKQQGL